MATRTTTTDSAPTVPPGRPGARRGLLLMLGAATLALAIALTVITGGSFSARTGYDQAAAEVSLSDWWTLWAVPPVEIALIGLLAAVMLIAGRREARGYALGCVALLVFSVCSPLAVLAQSGLLAAHMLQHVLIGAVAPLLALLTLPRAIPGPDRLGRWRILVRPPIAFALWVLSTVAWLLPAVHHQVLMHQSLWILQQVAFFIFGAILWVPIIERLTTAPRWFSTGAKCAYMGGVWFVGLTLANFYWFSGTAFYGSHAAAAEAWGLTPLEDQAHAGTVMMLTHCLIAFQAITMLFYREARERSLQQRLVEAGYDPERARWAVRYGGAEEMAREAGIHVTMRAGID